VSKVKKLIASRKLKSTCVRCDKEFPKGDIYYKQRTIVSGIDDIDDKPYIYGNTIYECPRCHYKRIQHEKRFQEFKKHCKHPKEFITEEWSYIPGECVKQPDHFECRLCGKIL